MRTGAGAGAAASPRSAGGSDSSGAAGAPRRGGRMATAPEPPALGGGGRRGRGSELQGTAGDRPCGRACGDPDVPAGRGGRPAGDCASAPGCQRTAHAPASTPSVSGRGGGAKGRRAGRRDGERVNLLKGAAAQPGARGGAGRGQPSSRSSRGAGLRPPAASPAATNNPLKPLT